jgi:hypothetical protein
LKKVPSTLAEAIKKSFFVKRFCLRLSRPNPVKDTNPNLFSRGGELGYNRRERKESKNGGEEELESQNIFDGVKNLSDDKGVRDLG